MINYLMIIFILYIIALIVIKKRKKKHPAISLETISKSQAIFIQYLDRFYISNFKYTIISVLLYFCGNLGLFIYLRRKIIMQNFDSIFIFPIDPSLITFDNKSLLFFIFNFILFIITIICYKIFLDILFFNEVLKLHLYLNQKKSYATFIDFIYKFIFMTLGGKLYLFFYNVSQLRELPSLNDLSDYQEINEYNYIYENHKIQYLSKLCVGLATKFKFFLVLSKVLLFVFNWLYKHIRFDRYIKNIPYLLFIIILFYDFLHYKLYFIYYAILPLFIINFFFKTIAFYTVKDLGHDQTISNYLYFVLPSYRYLIQENITLFLNKLKECDAGKSILCDFKNKSFINYILNNDLKKEIQEKEVLEIYVNLKAMYNRYMIITCLTIVLIVKLITCNNYFLILTVLNKKTSVMTLLILILLISIYCSNKTFKLTKNAKEDLFCYYEYKRIYGIMFWILAIIQIYIYWMIFIKPGIFFMDTEVLLKAPYDIFSIVKEYTVEEKILYLFQYFEYYGVLLEKNNILQNKEDLLNIIKQINFHSLIDETTTLTHIKNYIQILFEKYRITELFYEDFKKEIIKQLQKLERLEKIQEIMDPLISLANILVIWKFFAKIIETYNMIADPHNPDNLLKILKLIKTVASVLNKFR